MFLILNKNKVYICTDKLFAVMPYICLFVMEALLSADVFSLQKLAHVREMHRYVKTVRMDHESCQIYSR